MSLSSNYTEKAAFSFGEINSMANFIFFFTTGLFCYDKMALKWRRSPVNNMRNVKNLLYLFKEFI